MPMKVCQNCGLKVIADARAAEPFYCQKCATKLGVAAPMEMRAAPRPTPNSAPFGAVPSVAPPPPEQPPMLMAVEPEPPKPATVKITCPYCTAVFASKKLEVTAKGRCPICKHEVLLFPDGVVKKPEEVIPKAPPPPAPPPMPVLTPVEPVDSALPQQEFSLPQAEPAVSEIPELAAAEIPELADADAPVSDGDGPQPVEPVPSLQPAEEFVAAETPPEPVVEESKESEKTGEKSETKSSKRTTSRPASNGKIGDRKTSRFSKDDKKGTGRFSRDAIGKKEGGETIREAKPTKAALVFFTIPFLVGIAAFGVNAMELDGKLLNKLGTMASNGFNKIPSQIAGYMVEARKRKPPPRRRVNYIVANDPTPPPSANNNANNPNVDVPPPPPPTREERMNTIDTILSDRVAKFNTRLRGLHSAERGADEERKAMIAAELQLLDRERKELEALDDEYRQLSGQKWSEFKKIKILNGSQ